MVAMLRQSAWIAVAALLVGCSGHAVKRHSATRCPPASGRIDGVDVRLRDPVCGDVDGTGGRERVGIAVVHHRMWLGVRFEHRTLASALPSDEADVVARLVFVNGLAALDRRRGLEIVATVHQGASTAFGQIFSIEHGALTRVRVPEVGNEFAYEGSVTHFDVIDCVRPRSGLIRISGYGWDGRSHYIQGRALYRIVENRLVQVAHTTSRQTVQHAGRFREFAEPQPFPHCMVIRNTRTH